MAMRTMEEGEGLLQVGDNFFPHGADQHSLIQEIYDSRMSSSFAPTDTGAGTTNASSQLFGDGNAGSILRSPNGTDFELFDSSALNSPGADVSAGGFPGGDALGAVGGNVLDSVVKSFGDMVGATMPMGILTQLFQFLMSFFTEGLNQVAIQMNQSAAAAAAATKKFNV